MPRLSPSGVRPLSGSPRRTADNPVVHTLQCGGLVPAGVRWRTGVQHWPARQPCIGGHLLDPPAPPPPGQVPIPAICDRTIPPSARSTGQVLVGVPPETGSRRSQKNEPSPLLPPQPVVGCASSRRQQKTACPPQITTDRIHPHRKNPTQSGGRPAWPPAPGHPRGSPSACSQKKRLFGFPKTEKPAFWYAGV